MGLRYIITILEVKFPETFFSSAFCGPGYLNNWQMAPYNFFFFFTWEEEFHICQLKTFHKNIRKSLYGIYGLFSLICFLMGPDATGAKIILVLAFGISANIIHSLVHEL